MDIYYFSNIRFPSEKAHALYVDRAMRSFGGEGASVTVVAPRRFGRKQPCGDEPYQVVYLPTLDLFPLPIMRTWAFHVGAVAFALSAFVYAALRIKKDAYVITNDSVVAGLLSWMLPRVIWEVHDYPEKRQKWYQWVACRAHRIMVNNKWKRERLIDDFGMDEKSVFVAHNGVDISFFQHVPSQKAARRRLGVPIGAMVAVYTGHLYSWKGVDTLARAASHMPEVQIYFVGGTERDLARMRACHGSSSNVHFVGHRAHEEIPLWQAAADVLVLPNTAKEAISLHYTSPMKLFEYLAGGRPVVASDIPSVREVVDETCAILVPPDDARVLAEAILSAINADPLHTSQMISRARERAACFTWSKRACDYLAAIAD